MSNIVSGNSRVELLNYRREVLGVCNSNFWPTVVAPTVCHAVSSVCLSSVTFCIVAKRHIFVKNCLNEQIGLPPETTVTKGRCVNLMQYNGGG